jgi:hypothetical protein
LSMARPCGCSMRASATPPHERIEIRGRARGDDNLRLDYFPS